MIARPSKIFLGSVPLPRRVLRVLSGLLASTLPLMVCAKVAASDIVGAGERRWLGPSSRSLFTSWKFWEATGGLLILVSLLWVARKLWDRSLARQVALRTLALAEGKATLQESEARYRSILKASPDGITVTDLKGRILLVSPEAMALFHGEREADLVGRHIFEFLAPEDRDRARVNAERTVQGAQLGPTRYLALRTDGSTFPMEVNSAFNREEHGKPTSMILLIRDITESTRAEEALRASRELFSKAFAVCPDGFVITRLEDGVYLEINEGFTQLTGFTPGEIIGCSSVSNVMPVWPDPKDREGFVAALRDKGEVIDLEATFLKKDRTTFTALVSAKIFEAQGEKHIISITRDITEQKQAHAALRESEKRLSDILNSVNARVFMKDNNYRYTYVNPKVCESFGHQAEDILGKGDEAFFPPYSIREIRESDHLVIERGELIAREEKGQSAEGSHPQTFWAVKIPLRDGDGKIYGLCGISTDITPLKEAEEARRQLQVQLHQAQKLDSLGSLAGGLAHDMNNVLGAILGLSTANLQTQPPGSPSHHAFDTIAKAAARGGTMVRSLLGFARQSPAEELELDLNTILQEEARLLEHTTLSRVQLRMDLAPDLGPMRGDASALTHAFMNLCVNAVDAMPDQGILWLRTQNVDQGWIEVTVQDTGCGMARDVLDKALDPFFTTKGQGKGTGLGLSLVYSTVKAHQGYLEIQSQPGQGTCVKMRFPICTPDLPVRETAAELRSDTKPMSLSVLIVDDDDLVQSSLQMMLEALGHRTASALSGESALADLEAGLQPDVVILDMNMPGLGGAGTLPRLRELRPLLPVLLATGRTDQSAVDLIQAHPSMLLLPKPFTLKELQQSLETLLKA